MVHIWVSPIDWVDYFLVLGKYIHAEKMVLFEHTRDTFTPIAENGQFRPLYTVKEISKSQQNHKMFTDLCIIALLSKW